MSVVSDIIAAYRGPKASMRKQIEMGIEETQTLFYALFFGFLSFLGYLPSLAKRAFVDDITLSALAGAQFIASVFMMPLLMYGIAALIHWVLMRFFNGQGDYVSARRALFWAALVTSPIILLSSVISIYVPDLHLICAIITGGVFFWQWISCIKEYEFSNV